MKGRKILVILVLVIVFVILFVGCKHKVEEKLLEHGYTSDYENITDNIIFAYKVKEYNDINQDIELEVAIGCRNIPNNTFVDFFVCKEGDLDNKVCIELGVDCSDAQFSYSVLKNEDGQYEYTFNYSKTIVLPSSYFEQENGTLWLRGVPRVESNIKIHNLYIYYSIKDDCVELKDHTLLRK